MTNVVIHRPVGRDDDGTPFDCEADGQPWPCLFVRQTVDVFDVELGSE